MLRQPRFWRLFVKFAGKLPIGKVDGFQVRTSIILASQQGTYMRDYLWVMLHHILKDFFGTSHPAEPVALPKELLIKTKVLGNKVTRIWSDKAQVSRL